MAGFGNAEEGQLPDISELANEILEEKCPVSGMTEYLYENLRTVIHPESEAGADFWEIGDAIIEGYDVDRKARLVKAVNDIADALDLTDRVGYIRELKGGFDPKAAQKRQFIVVLDRIAERLREEPDMIRRLPGYARYDAWRETHDVALDYQTWVDAHETQAPEEIAPVPSHEIVNIPEEITEIAASMTSEIHILDSVPMISTAMPSEARAIKKRQHRRVKVEYEKMARGLSKTCKDLGYVASGELRCIRYDCHATPARCRKCKYNSGA